MADKQEKVEIMALWENVNENGFRYLTGHFNGARVVAFWNSEKRNEKEPDLRLYVQNKPKADNAARSEQSEDEDVPF